MSVINIGLGPGDQNADSLREGFDAVNQEFDRIKTTIKSITSSQNIQEAANSGILTATTDISLTVLETLPANFNCIIDTLGGDLTLVAGANVIFKDKDNIAIATPTMADGGRLSIYRIEGTNDFLLKGDL